MWKDMGVLVAVGAMLGSVFVALAEYTKWRRKK